MAVDPDTRVYLVHRRSGQQPHRRVRLEWRLRQGWGGLGSGDAQFNSPGGVGRDANGNLWVADQENDRVKKFDPNSNLIGVFGTSGTGPGQLSHPDDVGCCR